jgi:hypothetical protein
LSLSLVVLLLLLFLLVLFMHGKGIMLTESERNGVYRNE